MSDNGEYRLKLVEIINEEVKPKLGIHWPSVTTEEMESLVYALRKGTPDDKDDVWWRIHAKRDPVYATGLLTCDDATEEDKQTATETLDKFEVRELLESQLEPYLAEADEEGNVDLSSYTIEELQEMLDNFKAPSK